MRMLAGLVAGLFLVLTLIFLVAEAQGWMTPGTVSTWIGSGSATPVGRASAATAVVGLLAGDLVLPVPSSVVMTLSGMALGMWGGAAANVAGAMASALLGFGLCRRFGRRAFERFVGAEDAARVQRFMQRYGAWGIVLSRSVPMLTEVVSAAAGLSRLPLGRFAALSASGTLPICIVYAWAGSRGDHAGTGWAVLLALALPALGLAMVRWLDSRRANLANAQHLP